MENKTEWVSVEDGLPDLDEPVLCLGFKCSPDRLDTAQYEIMHRMYLDKPELTDHKGNPVKYGWSTRWWDTNPDMYGIFYWMPLPEPPNHSKT